MIRYIKNIIKNNKKIIENLSYLSILEIFVLVSPLIIYPYLIKVLGPELYGTVIIAQIVISYFSIFINFGFRSVSAKHIAIHRNDIKKLSSIVSTVLCIRFFIWFVILLIYLLVVYNIPACAEYHLLFVFSFGLTFNELLFPQFYFQGVEKMQFITIINITIKIIFIILIFVIIDTPNDYVFVPLLSAVGFFIGGVYSLYRIFVKDKLSFVKPTKSDVQELVVDALPLFATEIVCAVKDKFNYVLIGQFVGLDQIVIYDLGMKFNAALTKPTSIISMALFPEMSRRRSPKQLMNISFVVLGLVLILTFILNFCLPYIAGYFSLSSSDLLPVRIFLFAPIFLSISSYLASNFMVAFGYNKYILYSIIVTTVFYILFLTVGLLFFDMTNILTFIVIAVLTYFVEMVYRLLVTVKLASKIQIN